ncbi:hypothetical protein Tco_1047853 [Tanacetum coccineum]
MKANMTTNQKDQQVDYGVRQHSWSSSTVVIRCMAAGKADPRLPTNMRELVLPGCFLRAKTIGLTPMIDGVLQPFCHECSDEVDNSFTGVEAGRFTMDVLVAELDCMNCEVLMLAAHITPEAEFVVEQVEMDWGIPDPVIIQCSLLSSIAKDSNELVIMVHIKAMLLSFITWSTIPGIGLFRSMVIFVATTITIREASFSVKYLHGNHSFLYRKTCNKSSTIARMQTTDANTI